MELKKQDVSFIAIKVEDELPTFPQIVTVLIDGRIPMMAQIRPSENGHVWWTLGMAEATKIEKNKKCVTHWLKSIKDVYVLSDIELKILLEKFKEKILRQENPLAPSVEDFLKDNSK